MHTSAGIYTKHRRFKGYMSSVVLRELICLSSTSTCTLSHLHVDFTFPLWLHNWLSLNEKGILFTFSISYYNMLPWDIKTPRAPQKHHFRIWFFFIDLWTYYRASWFCWLYSFFFLITVKNSIKIGLLWSLLGSSEIKYIVKYRQRE